MKYDLTVIIPVYNTGKYLRRCLESIINQEGLKQCALRVVCINDGSTDDSQTIIEEYIKKYPFIEIFNKENGGLADVRNKGLQFLNDSLYTVSLDSDDFWCESFLVEFNKIKSNDYDLIFFDINLVDFEGKLYKKLKVNPNVRKYNSKNDFMVVKHAAWAKICKTNLYDGITFPKGKLYEDLAVMPYITCKANNIYYIQEPLINYVINTPGSIMNSSKSNIFDIYDSLTYLFDLFGDQFDTYKEELQYLAIEHLCVGHTYRLLHYANASKKDFKDIVFFMEKYFGKHWDKNKYVKRGVQKVNINSSLSYVVPVFLKFLKYGGFSVWPIIKKVKGS
ncbi:glycosyltransferase family 2 protein [Streptococcus australis]|jgi:polysaccharide biosynthesis protein, putative rhamnosyl transferase|uniref:glycosyltransferase family 2 protein n=1 Tax=Streptococcus australis TaxID=113107 RepID=UPI00189C4335|nr:glycosyltransferase family 2 protein [Streptococcus australis]MDB8649467.1 glycosyltransferase family 2 protein [Streptococcus australis]